ncbi:cation/H(+) antiporter 4-like [Corylus avellana]|uniref:cation/H(+) antiporter 4-like n=1 Tax=Corylus avellana TaxID=13451 RepID=UPI00286C7D1E|nr:cation/H(+) antiporter 4-like [Corylus avellana]
MVTINDCTELPGPIHSNGLWNTIQAGAMPYALPLLELQMVFIFAIVQAAHHLLKRFGIPRFTTQLLVGLVLGPSLLGRFGIFKNVLFSIKSQETLGLLSVWSYILFMFLSGVKMDLGMINRTGRKALYTGVACILLPLVVGLSTQLRLSRYYKLDEDEATILPYVTAIHCLTPFPVLVWLLEDLQILNSELGRLSLSTALVSDTLSVFLLLVSGLTGIERKKGRVVAAIDSVSIIIHVIVIVFAIRPTMFWVIRQTPEGRPIKDTYIHAIILVVLGSAYLSHLYGQTLVVGPFFLGLAIPDGPPLGSAIVNKFNSFVRDVFLPILVTTCGMRIDLSLIKFDYSYTRVNGILIVLTFVVKIVASLVPPLLSKMPFNDALTLALLLSCKGVVQIFFYAFLKDNETMANQTYALACVSVLLTAIFVPLLVKYLYHPSRKYAGYQKRDIMHCKRNAELRILACIHRQDEIIAITKLLEVSCPSSERPLAIYVLHLIELIGRASPIFISHQMQKKTMSNSSSYSENIILALNQFKQGNDKGVVSVNVFTAISPPKFMHEDICILGLDKLTSLIILPFHRKWSIGGSIESEDNTIRTLNCSVLELAPCSVGILIDRGHLGRSIVSSESSYSIAMIFLGGNDDREALTFAKRMANDSNITLTVVQFVAVDGDVDSRWDKLLDNEILKDVKLNNVGDEYVIFLEEMVKDGPQTALIVRSMVDEYDLIIVGRRHNLESSQTSGLAEWSEFSELGIIGDLLASSDLDSRTSVLVVQQQQNDGQVGN